MSNQFALNLTKVTKSVHYCSVYLEEQSKSQGNAIILNFSLNVVVLTVVNSVIGILTTFMNILVMASILKNRFLRASRFMILLVSLSLTDFFVGLFVHPLIAAGVIIHTQDLPQLHCLIKMITGVVGVTCVGASLGHVALISVERYLAVRFASRYKSIMTFRKTLTFVTLVWIFFLLYSVFSVVLFPQIGEAFGHPSVVIVTFLVTGICYTRIFIKVGLTSGTINNPLTSASAAAQQRIKREKKIAKFMLFTVTILALFSLPFVIVFVLITNYPSDLNYSWTGKNWSRTIVFTNSLVNPFLYCWKFQEIRKDVLKLIGCAKIVHRGSTIGPTDN